MNSSFHNKSGFSPVKLSRNRWNVLDMIDIIGGHTISTHLLYDVDMTWAETLREKLKALGINMTVTAILLKAIGLAQRTHPLSRTIRLPDGRMALLHKIIAGFTVERFVDNEPTVFFGAIDEPDSKPLTQIADELKAYGEEEIEAVPQLAIEHRFNHMPWLIRQFILWLGMWFPSIRLRYMGATFGVSSLGKFGCRVLLPPCVSPSTFGIGAIEQRPVAIDGKVEIRPIMSLVLNFDHRVIDGAPAARFMQDVVRLIQGDLEEFIQDELEKLASNKIAPAAFA